MAEAEELADTIENILQMRKEKEARRPKYESEEDSPEPRNENKTNELLKTLVRKVITLENNSKDDGFQWPKKQPPPQPEDYYQQHTTISKPLL